MRINAPCNEGIDCLCDSETAVYEDSGLAVANNGAISLAPASQGGKLQSEPSKLLRFSCVESLNYVFTQDRQKILSELGGNLRTIDTVNDHVMAIFRDFF